MPDIEPRSPSPGEPVELPLVQLREAADSLTAIGPLVDEIESRLDRLPIGPFHRRIMLLIGIGMFFDGFDIYIAGTVLGVTLKTGFSTLAENAAFISATFVGMMLGSFGTGLPP